MLADTPLEDVVRHADHLIEHLGVDGVGFGSDFDGAVIPQDMATVAGLPDAGRCVPRRRLRRRDASQSSASTIGSACWNAPGAHEQRPSVRGVRQGEADLDQEFSPDRARKVVEALRRTARRRTARRSRGRDTSLERSAARPVPAIGRPLMVTPSATSCSRTTSTGFLGLQFSSPSPETSTMRRSASKRLQRQHAILDVVERARHAGEVARDPRQVAHLLGEGDGLQPAGDRRPGDARCAACPTIRRA